jgi:hypothetical protein
MTLAARPCDACDDAAPWIASSYMSVGGKGIRVPGMARQGSSSGHALRAELAAGKCRSRAFAGLCHAAALGLEIWARSAQARGLPAQFPREVG